MNKKRHVLIIASGFAPLNSPGAVRLTKIAKYFDRKKWKVSVLTTKGTNYMDIKDTILQKDIGNSNISVYRTFCFDVCFIKKFLDRKRRKKINNTSNYENSSLYRKKSIKFKRLRKIVEKCFPRGNISWYPPTKRFIARNLKLNSINLMLTSYGSMTSHRLGYYIKKKRPDIFWIADFRDIYLRDVPKTDRRSTLARLLYAKRDEQRVLNNADRIITVSEGLKNSFDKKLKDKVHAIVIYNGYDKEDIIGRTNLTRNIKHFTISYVGRLYKNLRDPTLLFDVLSELLKEGAIKKKKLLINYAGAYSLKMKKYVERFGLSEIYCDYGFVSREKSLQIQKNSHLLVLLSWNLSKSRGILTSKLYEYMNVGKPIICLMKGNDTDELGKIIKMGHLGIACDYQHYAESKKRLRKFLLEKYQEYIHTGRIEHQVNNEFVHRFDYENIVDEIINIYNCSKEN